MSNTHTVYGLLNEIGTVYYIGKTVNLHKRLRTHDNEAARGLTRIIAYHKLRKLHQLGIKAKTHHTILEENIPENLIDSREQFFIAHYKKLGVKLFNIALGGEGGKGHTPETNRRAAEKRRGTHKSEGARRRISEAKAGKPLTQAHKTALKKAWLTRKNPDPILKKKRVQKATLGKINTCLYEIEDPQGNRHTTPQGLNDFCRQQNLQQANLSKTLTGERQRHKGWKILKKISKMPIITSLLNQDLYKITMAQVVWKNFPAAMVEYTYKCRNGVEIKPHLDTIKAEIKTLCSLRFTQAELNYLSAIRYIDPAFIFFLRHFQLLEECVEINKETCEIRICGPWLHTIFFEVFLLAIISETIYRNTLSKTQIRTLWRGGDERLTAKIETLKNFTGLPFRLIEMGTRRRFSDEWQEHLLQRLITEVPTYLFGTSNVAFAMKYGIKPIGTMAHEYLQAFQAFVRLGDSQKVALETWAQFYRGDLGIALTDVICMDAFLRDFDRYYAKLFDGIRHDSGDPFIWGEKAIAHYKTLEIEPRTKALVFSDGLDIPKALKLCQHFEPRIKTSFGIGTNLTCDFPGVTPVNHVLKMTRCNDRPVAKLSDSPGKSMCKDESYLTYLKEVFQYPK